MGSIKLDFDVKIIDNKDYVPFDQVMQVLKNLDKFAPQLDLKEMAKQLEQKRDQIRANLG